MYASQWFTTQGVEPVQIDRHNQRMPFLGHNHYDGLDVSPDSTPPGETATDSVTRARRTVKHFARSADDESMLMDLLGLLDAESHAVAV